MRFCKVLLNDEVLFENVRYMSSFFERLSGLMFQKEPRHKALLFKGADWIHSFFCFVSFNALFIGKNKNILNHFKNVQRGKILPPVFGTEFLIEYLGEPVEFKEDDRIEVVFEG